MTSYCVRRVRPKSIQLDSCNPAFESVILSITRYQWLTPDVLTLAASALKSSTEMVARPSLSKPNLIFYLCQRSSIKISRHSCLESIQIVSRIAVGTECSITCWVVATDLPIICTDNSRLERDMTLTILTRYVQLPPLALVLV